MMNRRRLAEVRRDRKGGPDPDVCAAQPYKDAALSATISENGAGLATVEANGLAIQIDHFPGT